MPDLSSQIEDAADTPQSATIDGRAATARPIKDLIEADRYLQERTAAQNSNTRLGIRFFNTSPPGSV